MRIKSILILVGFLLTGTKAVAFEYRMLVRIYVEDARKISMLSDMDLDFATLTVTDHADVVLTQSELNEIQRRGFRTEVIQYEKGVFIPPEYHTLAETWVVLDSLRDLYPSIAKLDTCGYSQRFALPIPLFIISRNVGMREDEPSAMFTGMHHAREPIGNEICLYTIKKVLKDYPDSAYARRWIDSMEIQFVPISNPEGWKYITDSSLVNPWWRKNLRDNGNNGGPINPDSDGVDLNRNYDWRWTASGSTNPTNWTYRGPSPASESEIQTLANLATQRKFVVGISYHSYGYLVYYPWSYSGQYTPDDATLGEIAQNLSSQIGGYSAGRLGGSNQSSTWFYGKVGMYDFLIETAQSFIPPPETISIECQKNFRGLRYLLNRALYSGITGHVRDSLTLQPLNANVEVLGLTGDSIVMRTSDSLFGRFYRLLRNGTYTMRFSKTGYITKTISNIPVTSDSLTKLEVLLAKPVSVELRKAVEVSGSHLVIWPNPFKNQCTIYIASMEDGVAGLVIYNVLGQSVRHLRNESKNTFVWDGKDANGKELKPGVYFFRLENGGTSILGKLVRY